MAVTAQDIIDKVRAQLIDTGSTKRWSDDELLGWLSEAQREIVSIKPDASATIVIHPLIPGTRQDLPDDAVVLLNVYRNTNVDGTVAGRSVPITSRAMLDAFNLNWHTATPSAVVQSYIFDMEQMTEFYVYPPNNGSGYLEINYSAMPVELTALGQDIGIPDFYSAPLTDYVLYRAHQKDSDFAAGQGLATMYFQAFSAGLGLEAEKDKVDPNNKASTV